MTDRQDFSTGQPVRASITSSNTFTVEGAQQSVVSVSIKGGLVINDLHFPGRVDKSVDLQVQNDPRSGITQIIGTFPAKAR